MTFDASWGIDNTEKIVEILNKYDVKASFFLVGAWVDANPDKVKMLYDGGHDIGNHTNTHPSMKGITKEKLIKEIEVTDNKIKNITGEYTKLFRFPSGEYSNTGVEAVESTNHYSIQWNVDSIDWKAEGSEIEFNRVINKVSPGAIILFHSEAIFTPENLPKIIEYLKDQDYEIVKVSELIYTKGYSINQNGVQVSDKDY